MRRLLARATLGAAIGAAWGYLCNSYLGWVGVILTGAIGLGVSLWALRSLREIREQERELERILSSVGDGGFSPRLQRKSSNLFKTNEK